MDNQKETNCPLCDNHCPRTELRCGRGRSHFGEDEKRGPHGGHRFAELEGMEPEEMTLMQLMIRCGFIAGKKVAHNKEDALSSLSEEDQKVMRDYLVRLLNAWKADYHEGHRH